MALPKPTFNLTIPSISDDTTLNCRIYHPRELSDHSRADTKQWHKRGAILAHPYALAGGDQDDPVLAIAGLEILKAGFVLGTFNFRGAGSSKGRTSWTAKPEVSDYISFAGFFVHYLHHLDPINNTHCSNSQEGDPMLSPIYSALPVYKWPSPDGQATKNSIDLIIGGYSYGSMIATQLPTTDLLLSRFQNCQNGTAAAEVQLRAKSMARTWNQEYAQTREKRGRPRHSLGVPHRASSTITVGGDEAEPGTRRPSRDSRRSMDSARRSLDIRRSLNIRRHSSQRAETESNESESKYLEALDIPIPRTHYLLISPIPGPLTMLLTLFSDSGDARPPDACIQGRDKLSVLPTLCVYGGGDMMTGQKKLRRWAERLKGQPDSRFQIHEIPRAGHFWHEDGVVTQLRDAIAQWVRQIDCR